VTQQALPGSEQDFVINVGDRIYFDFDRYEIRTDAQPVLAAQATWLSKYPAVAVRIEGNCDERGTREYNLALGARRANAVRDFLVAHGVEPTRITTISYGKEKPIDLGSGDEADQHNRNAHTVLISGARTR
jgi:peptidoglycan-associated lipoprotein